jgi:hypothetical protein
MNFDELEKKHRDIAILLCNLSVKKYPKMDTPELTVFNESIRTNGVNFDLKINGIEFNFIDLVEELVQQTQDIGKSVIRKAVIDNLGNVNKLFPEIDDELRDTINQIKHLYFTLIKKELETRTKIFKDANDSLYDEFWDEVNRLIS